MKFHLSFVCLFCFLCCIDQARAICRVPMIERGKMIGKNGNVVRSRSQVNIGVQVTVNCNPGFVAVSGSRTAFCNDQGRWTFINGPSNFVQCVIGPRCLEEPPRISYGRIEGNSIRSGSSRTIKCNQGYYVSGPNTIYCNSGKWTEAGTCLENRDYSCPTEEQPVIENGFISENSADGIYFVNCDGGFEVTGPNIIFCRNGKWSEPGSCHAMSTTTPTTTDPKLCPRSSPVVQNGQFHGQSRIPGSSRKLVCDPEFRIDGGNKTVCSNREWKGHGTCVRDEQATTVRVATTTTAENSRQNRVNRCRRDPNVQNGRIQGSGKQAGATRNLVCNPNFVLEGNGEFVCKNGQWQGNGKCVRTTSTIAATTTTQSSGQKCPRRRNAVANGRITGGSGRRQNGAAGTLTCIRGHVVQGEPDFVCINGRWVGNGRCIPYRSTTISDRSTRQTTTTPSNPQQIRCSWQFPINVENGVLRRRGTRRARRIVLFCNPGYSNEESNEATCENGEWVGYGSCVPINDEPSHSTTTTRHQIPRRNGNKCPARIFTDANGEFVGNGRREGSKRRLECNSGFHVEGNAEIVCKNKQWTGRAHCVETTPTTPTTRTSPVNRQQRCADTRPREIENGEFRRGGRRELGIVCDEGYVLDGQDVIRCSNGVWTEPGLCRPTNGPENNDGCPDEPDIPNAHIRQPNPNNPNKKRFTCQDGFVLNGRNRARCEDGDWTIEGTCVAVENDDTVSSGDI